MPPSNSADSLQELLAHASWLRALARRLTECTASADDLTQDVWTRALERPPRTEAPLRGWLATVIRHLALERRRASARRAARERRAATPQALESAESFVDRAQRHRELVEHVLALEEPYRSTILARYFEELPPSEIAARLRVPVATVKTRLARGLVRLRARIDARHAGLAGAWLAGLAADAPAAGSMTLTVLGALLLAMKANIAAVFAALTLAGAAAWYITRPSPPAPVADPARASAAAPAEQAPASATGKGDARRSIPATPISESAAAPAVQAATTKPQKPAVEIRGRVTTLEGMGVAGARVESPGGGAEPTAEPTISDGEGRFVIAASSFGGELIASAPGLATLYPGAPTSSSAGHEVQIIVAPPIELAGRVVDDAGSAIEGALVLIAIPDSLRSQIPVRLDFSGEARLEAKSGAEGNYEFDRALAIRGAVLRVSAKGYVSHEEPAPLTSSAEKLLRLRKLGEPAAVLRGRVVDDRGAPVPGAEVSLGIDTTRTDDAGAFLFDLRSEQTFSALFQKMTKSTLPSAATLLALKPGFAMAQLEVPRGEDGIPQWPGEAVLVLRGQPLEIRGRVLEPDGKPVASALVWVANPSLFGAFGDPGARRAPELRHAESMLAGDERPWASVRTDERGAFTLRGLLDREYTLEAMDEATLLRVVSSPIRAGNSAVELVLPRDASYPVLRGKVISRDGAPIAGVRIFPMCDAFRTRFADRTLSTHHSALDGVTTEEDGEFEIRNVPKNLVYLRLEGPTVLPLEWGRHVEGGMASLIGKSADSIQIRMGRRCEFRVELTQPKSADSLQILNEKGEPLEVSELRGRSRREAQSQPLEDGRSQKLTVCDDATTLVLLKDGKVTHRQAIRLDPTKEVILRP